MPINFKVVPEHPTPEELLKDIVKLLPGSYDYWEQPDNLFKDRNGSFSFHGIFAGLSHYFSKIFPQLSENDLTSFFDFIEKCVVTDIFSESGLSNAVCTCFLENLAGEEYIANTIIPYLGNQSKEYFDKWNK